MLHLNAFTAGEKSAAYPNTVLPCGVCRPPHIKVLCYLKPRFIVTRQKTDHQSVQQRLVSGQPPRCPGAKTEMAIL
jgi:hypothetical protein